MIDWMTLRISLSTFLEGETIIEKFSEFLGTQCTYNSNGELIREKLVFDIDKLRSDEIGLFWQVQHNGKENYLLIAGSPASVEHGTNVFGSNDVMHCANVMHREAQKGLAMILPPIHTWQCMRLDFNFNYLLDSNSQVKQALRELKNGHGSRQKATNGHGDTVEIGAKSKMITGVIYDKGTQVKNLVKQLHKKGRDIPYETWEIDILSRLLRFELRLKRQWFEKLAHKKNYEHFLHNDLNTKQALKNYKHYYETVQPWTELTEQDLIEKHYSYFKPFTGSIGVTDMGTLLDNLKQLGLSEGRARGAYQTWALIKTMGYEQAKASLNPNTFRIHRSQLLLAGLTQTDLQNHDSNVLAFKRKSIELDCPVTSWSQVLQLVA
ncbi:phage replication protein CRI [mine drainage metagenome]|uniref:Phage replication protein CRI n=1 Tax=mine drainage metagenome TaxID=410659 RepID=A0A1J5RSV6_9ZZZZ